MRSKLTLGVAAVLLAAGSAVMMAAPSASAIQCPPGTRLQRFNVGQAQFVACVPYQQCDPAACPATAAPGQE